MRSFRTLKPFTCRRMRSYSYTFPRSDKGDANPLFLEFSHPLAETEPRNTKHFEVLDLSPYLNPQGFCTAGISWNFGVEKKGKRNPWEQRNLQLQVTDIVITTRIAYNRALVRAAVSNLRGFHHHHAACRQSGDPEAARNLLHRVGIGTDRGGPGLG